MVASKSHLVLAQVANPMGSMMIRVRLTNLDRQRYLRLTVLPALEQSSTSGCFSRGGGGAGGAGHEPGIKQEGPATTRQLPCGMGLWNKTSSY
jgi:hypothetical protein